MTQIRLGKAQKFCLLLIYEHERKQGQNAHLNTVYLREKVDAHFGTTTAPNNFRVALHRLADHEYLRHKLNTDFCVSIDASEQENMWQLTENGRQWAQAALCSALTPTRRYIKSGRHTNETKRQQAKKKKA